MVPSFHIVAWGRAVPWAEPRQVEQDLIISRAVVALFDDPFLRRELRFRGGTALNKLHFPTPMRYSEDIDLVRTTTGPIGPILDQVRAALEPWLGRAGFDRSSVAPKLGFRVPADTRGQALTPASAGAGSTWPRGEGSPTRRWSSTPMRDVSPLPRGRAGGCRYFPPRPARGSVRRGGGRRPMAHQARRWQATQDLSAPMPFARCRKRLILCRAASSNSPRSTGSSITRRRSARRAGTERAPRERGCIRVGSEAHPGAARAAGVGLVHFPASCRSCPVSRAQDGWPM